MTYHMFRLLGLAFLRPLFARDLGALGAARLSWWGTLGQLTNLDFLDISECVDLSVPKPLEKFKDIAEGWDESEVQ
jgi:hypothetical protein